MTDRNRPEVDQVRGASIVAKAKRKENLTREEIDLLVEAAEIALTVPGVGRARSPRIRRGSSPRVCVTCRHMLRVHGTAFLGKFDYTKCVVDDCSCEEFVSAAVSRQSE